MTTIQEEISRISDSISEVGKNYPKIDGSYKNIENIYQVLEQTFSSFLEYSFPFKIKHLDVCLDIIKFLLTSSATLFLGLTVFSSNSRALVIAAAWLIVLIIMLVLLIKERQKLVDGSLEMNLKFIKIKSTRLFGNIDKELKNIDNTIKKNIEKLHDDKVKLQKIQKQIDQASK